MSTLAVCGLGQMGAAMAGRFLDCGDHDVVVWNRSPEKARPLVDRGARQASTPAEAAKGADAVITMLATAGAVRDVVFGDQGLVNGLATGATLIEMSTIGPAAVRQLRQDLPAEVQLLDAPVLGSVRQATDGQLKVFVGGDENTMERWRSVLEQLGTLRRLGPQGAGAAMKLVANTCLGILMTGLGEALAVADGLGLQQSDVLDILAESPIGATVRSKRANIESGTWQPNFKLGLAAKDMGLVAEAARSARLRLAVAPAARAWLDEAAAAGLGDSDYSAVIEKIRSGSAG